PLPISTLFPYTTLFRSVEVHRERVVHFLADLERDGRRGRRHDRVDLLEDPIELLLDQRADLLRLHVVRIVVTGRERVRAEDHAPLHLGAEASAARAPVRLEQVRPLDAEPVTHTVIACQVRGRLRRLDEVVDGETVVSERERYVDELRALALKLAQRVADRALDTLLHAFDEELLRHAETHALHAAAKLAPEILARQRHRGRVARVLAEERLAHDRAVFDAVRDWPDLVQRRCGRD